MRCWATDKAASDAIAGAPRIYESYSVSRPFQDEQEHAFMDLIAS